jgi:hypothetical protein
MRRDQEYIDQPAFDFSSTSQKSAKEFAPKANTHAERMVAVIREKPRTAREAAAVCVERFGGEKDSYRKRTSALKAAGVLIATKARLCDDSGKMAEELGVAART